MPKTTEKVKVIVTEDPKGELRAYSITVKAEGSLFFLSDAFVERGLVPKLTDTLREAVRKATEDYIGAADKYLAGTKPAPNGYKMSEIKTGAAA